AALAERRQTGRPAHGPSPSFQSEIMPKPLQSQFDALGKLFEQFAERYRGWALVTWREDGRIEFYVTDRRPLHTGWSAEEAQHDFARIVTKAGRLLAELPQSVVERLKITPETIDEKRPPRRWVRAVCDITVPEQFNEWCHAATQDDGGDLHTKERDLFSASHLAVSAIVAALSASPATAPAEGNAPTTKTLSAYLAE